MELKDIQQKLIQEMKEQGAKIVTIKSIIAKLDTVEQCQEMLDYLVRTRNIPIPAGRHILKAMEIGNHKKQI